MAEARKVWKTVIFALIVCITSVAGWRQMRKHQAFAEAEAAEAIRGLGGLVILDAQKHVRAVDLRLPDANQHVAEALRLVPKLPYLEVLQLGGTDVEDQHLQPVASSQSLTTLGLNDTALSDVGLVHLIGLHKLRALYLARANITSTGLGSIAQLSSLEILDLSETKVGGDIFALSDLEDLQHLLLQGMEIDDQSIASLGQLRRLSRLTLRDSQVSDQALSQLRKAKPGILIDR